MSIDLRKNLDWLGPLQEAMDAITSSGVDPNELEGFEIYPKNGQTWKVTRITPKDHGMPYEDIKIAKGKCVLELGTVFISVRREK